MDDLPIDFSQPKYDLLLSPPVMNAAGTLGFAPRSSDLVDFGELGAFVTNPVSLYPRTPARARTSQPFPGGFLMHSGYPNPGLSAVICNPGHRPLAGTPSGRCKTDGYRAGRQAGLDGH